MKNSTKPQPKGKLNLTNKFIISLVSAGAIITAFMLLTGGPDEDITGGASRGGKKKGEIIGQAKATILNPNGDQWITKSGEKFQTNEYLENELLWTALPFVDEETVGDLATGQDCGPTDIIGDVAQQLYSSYFIYSDADQVFGTGDEYYLFRMRIAEDPNTGQFGYSVLMDVDNLYGIGVDPNATPENRGFEIEIRVVNGGGSSGIYVDNVDGTTNGVNLASYSLEDNAQKSRSFYDCPTCGETYFYDFFIPFSVISDLFNVNGESIVRFTALTSSSGLSVLENMASDASGIDKLNRTTDEQIDLLIDVFPQASIGSGVGGVLPVELAKWNAYLDNDAIALEWTTMVEVNNDYFIVEKSLNGKEFTEVAQLKGQGNSSEAMEYIEYDYDLPSDAAIVYYRLTQYDFDGKSKTFKTIPVKLTTQQESELESGLVTLKSYPNPFTNQITIDLEGIESGSVEIYDLRGKLIHQEQFTNKLFNISNLDQLTPGNYLLQIKDAGALIESTQIVKQ